MISWCVWNTSSEMKFEDVVMYIQHISAMNNARNKEDFDLAHNSAMLDLYGIKPIWNPEGME